MTVVMLRERIKVGVWERAGAVFRRIGSVGDYQDLMVEPRHQDLGIWTMTLAQSVKSDAITPGRLISTEFRGDLRTWVWDPDTLGLDEGLWTVTYGGFDALAILDRMICYPSPSAPMNEQDAQWTMTGPAETVIVQLVLQNAVQRYGYPITLPASQGRGATVTATPSFANLREEVLRLARRGGLGVRMGLRTTSSAMRAEMVLEVYEPRTLSTRVKFKPHSGSIDSAELVRAAPKLTKAIVSGAGEGAGRKLLVVTTPQSEADAEEWDGHREGYVEGPETHDDGPLIEAGRDALAEGAATVTLSMQAVEPRGTRAFEAFFPGDSGTAVLAPGRQVVDTITAARVTHEGGGVPQVSPVFGDPDRGDEEELDPRVAVLTQELRRLRRALNAQATNRKRGLIP